MANFVYYNVNPSGVRENDCVTRAITLATGLPYKKIAQKLYLSAKLLECDKLNFFCYSHLLDDVFKFERVPTYSLTVNEFANIHPYGTYLIRMNGHISVLKDGTVYDIWDCRREIVTDAWLVR